MLRVYSMLAKHQHLPTSLARLFSEETLSHLNVTSCLISATLAVLLIATALEEFGIPDDGSSRLGRSTQMGHHAAQQFKSVSVDVQSHRRS